METAIQVIWWIALIVALVGTLIILKQVFLILRVLSGIHRLGAITLEAARGIAGNVEQVPSLSALDEPQQRFRSAAGDLADAVESLRMKFTRLAEGRLPEES